MISSTFPRAIIIAEAGVNHNGSLQRALEMVDFAAEAGADIIKFQTFKAVDVVSRYAPKAKYQIRNTGNTESQLEMARKLELDHSAHIRLFERCKQRRIEFLSSPFDMSSLQFLLHSLRLPRIKIGSGEISNYPFLLALARSRKKIILSTGMSTLGEVEDALGVIAYGLTRKELPNGNRDLFKDVFSSIEGQNALCKHVSLLHCTTEYPADIADVNLKAMDTLKAAFRLPVGLSDHTLGIAIPIAAVARGAQIIEKHFTLDKNMDGPDHISSLDPSELKLMIDSIRNVERALGSGIKFPSLAEKNNLHVVRRSLTASKVISKGDVFTTENLTTKRPGTGIPAMMYWNYLGTLSNRDYQEDEQIDT